ncbi:TlyA family RNA methyltransferase [Proteinivorax hydrogeniformans]|uniref:TlyA family RNA methyltransferase n=1 Tax=Proteinivorax hydrogeniformans TaxID=1826727 RepID=A0AAU8HQW1_9FIRM
MKTKRRLDQLLVEQGYFDSREKAKRAIMAGLVFSEQKRMDKPGANVSADISITVKGNDNPYVSRGGLKLDKAIKVFNLKLDGKVIVDVGASTGGFTDCALKHSAKLVYAVDVGYGQLAWSLRNDERVVNMERTNFRHVKVEQFDPRPQVAVADASFISLKLLLPKIKEILSDDGQVMALIKPQFEAGRERVGKKGVVRDKMVHIDVVKEVVDFAQQIGLGTIDINYSPIKGPEGNIEYLLLCGNSSPQKLEDDFIEEIINLAHSSV